MKTVAILCAHTRSIYHDLEGVGANNHSPLQGCPWSPILPAAPGQ